MRSYGKYLTVIIWNIIIFAILIGAFELILGDWLKRKPAAAKIPNTVYNKKLRWDARELYKSETPVLISYSRDKQGYRNQHAERSSSSKIVLTIGGSTTDQRFVNDSDTWQEKLEQKLTDYNIINGGVDGQSSLGHLQAVRHWHGPELGERNVSAIIFYIGINDLSLLNRGTINTSIQQEDRSKPLSTIAKESISQNSFLNKVIKQYFLGHRLPPTSSNWLSQHGAAFTNFNPKSNSRPKSININTTSPAYISLIQKLALETHAAFPQSKVIFVQQQIPGCVFRNSESVLDRHPIIRGSNPRYCAQLGEVYQLQDKAIASLPGSWRPNVLKMYLTNVISDEGVYDAVHTNAQGSAQIASYLHRNLLGLQ